MLDTLPEQRRRYFDLLRALTPQQRARKVVGLCRTARAMAMAGLRLAHPDASDEELRVRLAVRLYGPELARRVFGAVPTDAR